MKLNIGDRYNLSDKLKKAFEINEDTCKIISISNSITTLQINSEIYSIKTETALENLSLSYTPKMDLSEDSPKRKRKKEKNDNSNNVVDPKPVSTVENEEVVVSPQITLPELPPPLSTEPVQPIVEEPIQPTVKEPVKPVIEEPIKPIEPEIITIIPENNNISPSPIQDNDEPENPDEGFF